MKGTKRSRREWNQSRKLFRCAIIITLERSRKKACFSLPNVLKSHEKGMCSARRESARDDCRYVCVCVRVCSDVFAGWSSLEFQGFASNSAALRKEVTQGRPTNCTCDFARKTRNEIRAFTHRENVGLCLCASFDREKERRKKKRGEQQTQASKHPKNCFLYFHFNQSIEKRRKKTFCSRILHVADCIKKTRERWGWWMWKSIATRVVLGERTLTREKEGKRRKRAKNVCDSMLLTTTSEPRHIT